MENQDPVCPACGKTSAATAAYCAACGAKLEQRGGEAAGMPRSDSLPEISSEAIFMDDPAYGVYISSNQVTLMKGNRTGIESWGWPAVYVSSKHAAAGTPVVLTATPSDVKVTFRPSRLKEMQWTPVVCWAVLSGGSLTAWRHNSGDLRYIAAAIVAGLIAFLLWFTNSRLYQEEDTVTVEYPGGDTWRIKYQQFIPRPGGDLLKDIVEAFKKAGIEVHTV